MIVKHKPIDIDINDIFKNDKLDRKETIINLSKLISSTESAFTLSINANWGSGKTTFIKLWQAYLTKELNVKSIYFSAWEDDFSKEPLIAILGQINQYIKDNFTSNSEVEENFEKVKELGGKILRRGIPSFLKGATAGVLDFEKGYEAALGAIVESSAKELIDNYSKNKLVTEEFKVAIHNLLSNIDDNKPFIIFIDELDRCRPTYSIELLERVKHILGIDGLIFVLSIDKTQLSESIKSQYGNIDTDNYLKRFIDMQYNLKNISINDFCEYLYTDIYEFKKILKHKNIEREYGKFLDELSMIKYLSNHLKLTLREIEQIFIQLRIIFSTIEPNSFEVHFRIIVLFVVLKMKLPIDYESLIIGDINENKLLELLIDKKNNDDSKDLEIIIKATILATSKSETELYAVLQNELKIFNEMDESSEKSRQGWLTNLLEYGYGQYNQYKLNTAIENVIKKVEFIDSFNLEGLS